MSEEGKSAKNCIMGLQTFALFLKEELSPKSILGLFVKNRMWLEKKEEILIFFFFLAFIKYYIRRYCIGAVQVFYLFDFLFHLPAY